MLIAPFKDKPILWDKQLKDNANRQKTKKAMAPLFARFEMAQPPRNLTAIKARWHSLRRSVLRYMKKQIEAAGASLLMAAILFSPVHEHKEFFSLSLIGSTFDSVAGTCCITVHKARFLCRLQSTRVYFRAKFNMLCRSLTISLQAIPFHVCIFGGVGGLINLRL